MPLLGGLFSRKNKSSSRSKRDHAATSSIHTSELDSTLSSPTTSYVTPDKSIPSYPNARNLLRPDLAHELPQSNVYPSMTSISSSTGKKLRLPFGRKENALPRSDLSIGSSSNINSPNFHTSPRSANTGHVSTSAAVPKADPQDLRRLRPPPSRSAIFAAYGDPTNNPSVHSLPDDDSVVSQLSFPSSPSPPQSSKKTSFFTWAKTSTSKSSPSSRLGDRTLHTKSSPDPMAPTSLESTNSFNLKSFRHVRAPSPTRSNASNVSLTTPITRPRPRGESINSESSQRISVAAFREAQAKRSLAGSPSPSFRVPSPVPVLPLQTSTSTSEAARGRGNPQLSYSPQAVQLENKSMVLYTSDSDPSTSSDDGTEDETIKRRPGLPHSGLNHYERKDKGKARSELGHKSVVDDRFLSDSQSGPKSHSGHSRQSSGQTKLGTSGNGLDFSPRSQASLGHSTPAPKLQSSVSSTASSPTATVKLAGTRVALTPSLDISMYYCGSYNLVVTHIFFLTAGAGKPSREPPLSTHLNAPNTTHSMNNVARKYKPASDSESDSEDDAPLAALVGPRRPGSAMSSYSSLHARSTGNVTTRSTRSGTLGPAKPLIDINELTGPKQSFTSPEKSAAGFTPGPTLLSGVRRSMSPNLSDFNQPLTRKAPPVKFISPPSSPAKEERHLIPRTIDEADSTARSDPVTSSEEKSTSPEPPRDALTDRLSRAVNLKFVSSSSNGVGPNISRAKNSLPNQTESPNMSAGDDTSGSSHRLRSEKRDNHVPSTMEARRQPATETPSPVPAPKVDHSPPDEDLAQLLGTAGIKFMLRNDEIARDQSSESEGEEAEDSFEEVKREEVSSTGDRIAPILIKQRPPAPSFSVTSRPPFPSRDSVTAAQTDATRVSTASNIVTPRPRSITLTPSSTSSTSFNKFSVNDVNPSVPTNVASKSTSNIAPPKLKNDALKPPNVRQRSSTMVTGVPLSVQTSKAFHVPERPFAGRRNSPASSTGDSSSGRAPLTPRDGSEIGVPDRNRDEWSGGASGLGVKHQNLKRRSVNFEEDYLDSKPSGVIHSKTREHTNSNAAINDQDREARRKERRRSEAKAAIELGNVVNGPAPIVDDEDEMSLNHNISPRMSTMNPMMGMGLPMPMQMGFGSPNSVPWVGNMAQPMHSPYLMPPPADPNFIAAHQHAMMYAKQAYQMAVAQQAMAAAGDEWERGSTVGGYGGSGIIGTSPSPAMNPRFGMMSIGQGYGWSSPSSAYLPSSSQSMYGGPMHGGGSGSISNSRSEYGGARGSNNWPSSRSSYGESFGPSLDQYGRKNAQSLVTSGHAQRDSISSSRMPVMPAAQSQTSRGTPVRSGYGQRDSIHLPSASPIPLSHYQSGRGSPDGTPRPGTGSQPTSPGRGMYGRKMPPPSSWKVGM
ncbi:hypothetical protein BYT27DRAFT_7223644 [Phlegmacium glaucopus]|nr:hypothetical protein BYT27DRAFT_7223644 [Phlegmacium glaucopus]